VFIFLSDALVAGTFPEVFYTKKRASPYRPSILSPADQVWCVAGISGYRMVEEPTGPRMYPPKVSSTAAVFSSLNDFDNDPPLTRKRAKQVMNPGKVIQTWAGTSRLYRSVKRWSEKDERELGHLIFYSLLYIWAGVGLPLPR